MNHVERIRRKWAQGELCVGTVVALTDATVSELFGEAGYDFVWLDCEHSAMSLSDVLNHVRAARGAGAAAFVRVPSNDPVVVKPYLELHPAGIIVPRISSAEDAERAVASCRYPPRGVRGYGPSRGVRFGEVSPPDYIDAVSRDVMVILQIEHVDAVKEIDAILDVPGVDSIVTGPADMSFTMGLGGRPGHPDVVAAVEAVYRAAIGRGVPTGHAAGYDAEGIKRWLAMGISWIVVDGDWITLSRHARRVAAEIREISAATRGLS